jgi:aspartyl-tRNA(Asn)/glutamyl-tRNA(Gln) amidotransferase subunit C
MTDYWKIDKELIERVSKVARLSLTDKEKEEFLRQLGEVLDSFRVLNEIEAKEDPAFHPIKVEDETREDRVAEKKWEPMRGVKNKEGGYYKGPRIV